MNETKILTTDRTARKQLDPDPAPFVDGPSTNAGEPADPAAAFVIRHAIADEWAEFQRIVAARIAREPRFVWERCDRCGFVSHRPFRVNGELTKPGSPCLRCNWQNYVGGGVMREMSPADIKSHTAAVSQANQAESERMRRAEFERRNDERRRAGLSPFRSIDEWQRHDAARRPHPPVRKK